VRAWLESDTLFEVFVQLGKEYKYGQPIHLMSPTDLKPQRAEYMVEEDGVFHAVTLSAISTHNLFVNGLRI